MNRHSMFRSSDDVKSTEDDSESTRPEYTLGQRARDKKRAIIRAIVAAELAKVDALAGVIRPTLAADIANAIMRAL